MVIAVIGILGPLLLPALLRAKAASKRIDRANNLRQIALASHLYAADADSFAAFFGTGSDWFGKR